MGSRRSGRGGGRGRRPDAAPDSWREPDAFSASAEYLLDDLDYRQAPFLLEAEYKAPARCLQLRVTLGQPVAALLEDCGGDREQGASLRARLVRAALQQHPDLLLGLASTPGKGAWVGVHSVRFALHASRAACAALSEVLQAQALVVDLGGQPVALPASAEPVRLPPGHCEVRVQGLPAWLARCGATEALLLAAGYGAEAGCRVAHERRGFAVGPDGERLPGGCLDRLVAVVAAPPGDRQLRRLPRVLRGCGWEARIIVVTSTSTPEAIVWQRAPRPSAPPAAPAALQPAGGPGGMQRLFASAGLAPSVIAAAPPLLADTVALAALPAGSRAGLGSRPASGAAQPASQQQPAGGQPAAQAAAPPVPVEMPMPLAPPPADSQPADEPVFGAALAWVQDETDLTVEEGRAAIHAVRLQQPSLYGTYLGASRAGELPRALRAAVHAMAEQEVGEERAAPLRPGEPGGEGEEEGDGAAAAAGLLPELPGEVGGTAPLRRSLRQRAPAITPAGEPSWLATTSGQAAPRAPPPTTGGGGRGRPRQ